MLPGVVRGTGVTRGGRWHRCDQGSAGFARCITGVTRGSTDVTRGGASVTRGGTGVTRGGTGMTRGGPGVTTPGDIGILQLTQLLHMRWYVAPVLPGVVGDTGVIRGGRWHRCYQGW